MNYATRIVLLIFLDFNFCFLWDRLLLRSVQRPPFMETERSSLSWACRRITYLCVL